MSQIDYQCPHCKIKGRTEESYLGKLVDCMSCNKRFKLQRLEPPPLEIPDPPKKGFLGSLISTPSERKKQEKKELAAKSAELKRKAAEKAELIRKEELSRSEVEVLTSIEKKMGAMNEELHQQGKKLSSIKADIGCMSAILIIWAILSVIAGLVVLGS